MVFVVPIIVLAFSALVLGVDKMFLNRATIFPGFSGINHKIVDIHCLFEELNNGCPNSPEFTEFNLLRIQSPRWTL
jgi:hypothetical protein